jgi:hypothetical protein
MFLICSAGAWVAKVKEKASYDFPWLHDASFTNAIDHNAKLLSLVETF